VYVADYFNHSIRKITASGVVSTLAGSTQGYTDGTGTSAQFSNPTGVAVDGTGNVYVADYNNHSIRKITASGVVSTLAGSGTSGNTDGTGTSAQFSKPTGVAVDGTGNVYVADLYNHSIRKITTSGVVSTLAGSGASGNTDGTGTSAQFYWPIGVAVDGDGNVYVADFSNHSIRKITALGVVSTLAGIGTSGYTDGTGTSAKFNNPYGVAVDGAGNVYVGDFGNHSIRKITASGVVSTLAGSTSGNTDGTGTSAKFILPRGVAVDGAGNVYVADRHNHRIRKITLSAGSAETTETITANVCDSYTSPSGRHTWFGTGTYKDTIANTAGCDSVITVNLTVRDKTTETITANVCDTYTSPSGRHTWFGTGIYKDTIPNAAGCDSILTINLTVIATPIVTVSTLAGSTSGYTDGTGTSAQFFYPSGVAVDGAGNVYVADQGNNRIRKITASGVVSTLAGSSTSGYTDGTGASAKFSSPSGVAVDGAGNVYVADRYNHRIRKITESGVVSTLAGSGTSGNTDGTGTSAKFFYPSGVAVDGAGNVYVADQNNHSIRKITASGVVSTLAGSAQGYTDGTGTSAKFDFPMGVAVDGDGNVYVADYGNNRIRKITALGVVSTLAGGTSGYTDGTGASAKFDYPRGVAVDGAGNVYVADQYNHRIRKITASGVVSTLAGSTSGNTDGTGTSAQFYHPRGVAVDGAGNVYVADYGNHRIRKITLSAGSAETTETIAPDVCDSYTSPSGKTWITSNTYSDTIANTAGCDSVITVNLTVRYKSSFSFAETVYETFTSPSGKTWTNSGTYLDTIPNDVSCDSIITVDLTVINKLFVDTDGSSGTGKSWGNPMKTLDDAINAANKTDNHAEIWMRKGMYYPGGKSSSNRDSAFVVTNPNFELLGGFSGTETEPGQRNQTANPTILCGDIGKANDSSDNAYHVLIIAPNGSDIGPNFKLDGLTFKNGNADGSTKYTYENRDVYQSEGGSIVILGSGKSGQEISPTITNCHFEGNYGDYGSIYIRVPNGKSFATISHCTFKNNHSIYGAIFNDGQAGEVSPNIVNCAFDGNTSATSGAAIYNYGYGGKCSPTITSCVFNNNSASSMGGAIYNTGYGGTSNPVITNATFHANAAGSHAGAMYSFGNSGTCKPEVTNSIFYKNTKGGDDDHKFSEFYNYAAYPYVKNSSMQRASSTYTASTFNSLNSGTNNIFQTNPNFEAIADGNGADDVWRTGDDGLRLSSSSTNLLNGGTNKGAPTADILGNQRMGTTDMGAYEYVNCGLNVKLATSVTTHTATQSVVDGNFVCYCNSDNELLLALDTNGTGAVITPSQVKLYIGNPSTLSYNSAGGMITNTAGGVILERRWDVDPTTQPTSPVTVRYFYTNDNYGDIVTAMAGLTAPTTISSPSQLQFYKVTGGSSATFPNPHDTGVTGIVLTNGTTASTTVWVNGTHGVQDHTAEYLVSTFSGGGGGGGGGSSPLPVDLIQFEASPAASHTADLTWKTASELNNSHFVVERSYDGRDFQAAAIVQGNGTTQNMITYNHNDNTIDLPQNTVFYRLRQVDFDGTTAYSPVRRVDFEGSIIPNSVTLYPNPTKGTVTVSFTDDEAESHAIKVIDNIGRELYKQTFDGQAIELDLSSQATGIYFIILDSGESFKVIKQ
jgi:hypothetical protein